MLAYYGNALPLADSGEDEEEEIDTAAVEASFVLLMRWLHRQPEFTPEMLADKEVQKFIRDHTDTLDRAVEYSVRQRPMDDISIRRLKESNYVFSGFKTFHELNEAFPSLLDADGNRKPFEHFLNDVQKVNETYNRWYLKAEYNFAMASAVMAARWKQWWDDEDRDRYLLQYRTVGDKRVREAHRALHNVTLPITSRFWDEYFPPNGWNCFVAGTRVLMAGGEWKNIENIQRGESVIGGSGEYQLVTGTHMKPFNGEMTRIRTKRGITTCTPNHRFLTAGGWTAASDIQTGDILLQVGKVGTFNKAVNAIHNLYTLTGYVLMALVRKWKTVASKTVNGKIQGRDIEIDNVYAK